MARYTHFKVWLDGKIVDPEAAMLSVFTLTVLRGANVYEGLRAYWNPARRDLYVWKLDEHLKRLGDSMKVMRMQLAYSLDDLRTAAGPVSHLAGGTAYAHAMQPVRYGRPGGRPSVPR